jgi:hemerythrin-like domain-containing protein
MSESNTPNIGRDMQRIHAVISRGMTVATEHCGSLADTSVREGFVSYVQTFVEVLNGHHLLEDELAFPSCRDTFPETPFDLLTADHRQMVTILNGIKTAIEEVAAGGPVNKSVDSLSGGLKRIAEIWRPHIRVEEDHFSIERAELRLGVEENARLSQAFGEYTKEHLQPDYLVVPFLLYNLPPQEREGYVKVLPPIVTQQLVPIVWKEKWAPMMPFLLP